MLTLSKMWLTGSLTLTVFYPPIRKGAPWKQPGGGSHLVREANASSSSIPKVSCVSDRSPDRQRQKKLEEVENIEESSVPDSSWIFWGGGAGGDS